MSPCCRSCSKLTSENFDGDAANAGDGGDDHDENVDDDDDGRLLLWQVMSPTHTPSLALRLLHYHLSCIAATSIYYQSTALSPKLHILLLRKVLTTRLKHYHLRYILCYCDKY